MGSKSRALLLSLHEAAEMVGHHPNWTSRVLKSAGILPVNRRKSHIKTGNSLLFDRAEVEAFVRMRGGPTSYDCIEKVAYRTQARTATLEQRVELLEHMLGLRLQKLPMDKEELEARYLKAGRLVNGKKPSVSLSDVLDWGRYMLAVTEEYLFLMERLLGTEDPWKVFMQLGERLALTVAGEDPTIPSVSAAQEYLDIGRKNLRAVAYACSVRKYGVRGAVELVPLSEEGDVDEEILAIIISREVTRLSIKKQSAG